MSNPFLDPQTEQEYILAGWTPEFRPAKRWTCPHHAKPDHYSCDCPSCNNDHLRDCCERSEWVAIIDPDGSAEMVTRWTSPFEVALRKAYFMPGKASWADKEQTK